MSYNKKSEKLLKAYLKKHESNIKPNNQKAGDDSRRAQNGQNGKARKA